MEWDSKLAIFPRFYSANMLCLLRKQAEISELEERIGTLGLINNTSSDENRRNLSIDWSALNSLGKNSEEKKCLDELGVKLAEYSK